MNQSRAEFNRQQIEWRQSQVLTLAADGYSEREIAAQLKISQPTIHRDIALLKQQAKNQIQKTTGITKGYHHFLFLGTVNRSIGLVKSKCSKMSIQTIDPS